MCALFRLLWSTGIALTCSALSFSSQASAVGGGQADSTELPHSEDAYYPASPAEAIPWAKVATRFQVLAGSEAGAEITSCFTQSFVRRRNQVWELSDERIFVVSRHLGKVYCADIKRKRSRFKLMELDSLRIFGAGWSRLVTCIDGQIPPDALPSEFVPLYPVKEPNAFGWAEGLSKSDVFGSIWLGLESGRVTLIYSEGDGEAGGVFAISVDPEESGVKSEKYSWEAVSSARTLLQVARKEHRQYHLSVANSLDETPHEPLEIDREYLQCKAIAHVGMKMRDVQKICAGNYTSHLYDDLPHKLSIESYMADMDYSIAYENDYLLQLKYATGSVGTHFIIDRPFENSFERFEVVGIDGQVVSAKTRLFRGLFR